MHSIDAIFFNGSNILHLMQSRVNCSVILFEIGVASFDENGSLISAIKFGQPVRSYRLVKSGVMPSELSQFASDLRSFQSVTASDPGLTSVLRNAGIGAHLMREEQQLLVQNSKSQFIIKAGLAATEQDAAQALRDFAIQLSSSRVKEASERLDLHIVQAINALDELDKIINAIGTRMREWYGLHFPELDNLVQSLVAYGEIVSAAGLRTNISRQLLESVGIQEKKSEVILDAASRSKGGDMTPENLAIVARLANQVVAQSDVRRVLSDHIETAMESVAPNVKELLTAAVGARLIAKAGSLARLATLPASTIQVLGAEKALFRALKTGARPPKHGLLFQHPLIHSAPKWQRGKIARAVASKVAIAARIDYYRHSGTDRSLADKLNTRLNEIREKYKEPTPEKESERKYKEHLQRQEVAGHKRPGGDSRKMNRYKKGRSRFGKRRH